MRLRLKWSDLHGEGRLNRNDRKAMLDACGNVDALDFAVDAIAELTALYDAMLDRRFEMRRGRGRGEKSPGHVLAGHARAASLSPERRREIARKAANARWGNQ